MYFIPNGTWDDCMRHYRAERDARGSFWAQIEALERGDRPPDPEGGGEESKKGVRMPGMVPSYIRDGGSDRYHAIIHICDAADWRGGDDEVMTRLEFEPLSREEYEEFEKDPGDPREPDELPETKAVLEAVHDGSPRYGKLRSAEEPWSAINSVGMHLYRIAALEDRGGVPQWQQARNEGWTSW
ncbi:hypothetical protein MAPG_05636 [Magnaporthiopsis poae ATCC 64411]|uniref:Uncharacterized protein n=1 Tax=Magnaporthiopsis poae (strain ATCC 64411 / 73-15) TaxID=644358 RepID=A0A0C4DZX5_MAGP6|nr:hypothetical protein MAPG_05636 [Magnaporthiopsis poae ATCC 64411]